MYVCVCVWERETHRLNVTENRIELNGMENEKKKKIQKRLTDCQLAIWAACLASSSSAETSIPVTSSTSECWNSNSSSSSFGFPCCCCCWWWWCLVFEKREMWKRAFGEMSWREEGSGRKFGNWNWGEKGKGFGDSESATATVSGRVVEEEEESSRLPFLA